MEVAPVDRPEPSYAATVAHRLTLALLLCGLGVLVLAQVFAHGTRLREDVAATI